MRKRKAGCVPVRRHGGGGDGDGPWSVLLIQSSLTPEVWLFPKGGVEEGETTRQAATRETQEESGVTGQLGPKLGSWTLERSGRQKHSMWLLFVTNEYDSDAVAWKERRRRRRAWHSFGDARRIFTDVSFHLRRPELVEMLEAAEMIVKGGMKIEQLPPPNSDSTESSDE